MGEMSVFQHSAMFGAHTVTIGSPERTMKRFIEGEDRSQSTLFPEYLDDYIAEDNPSTGH